MGKNPPLMRQIPKTELSPDNGCIIDMKWQLGPLSYHASAAGKEPVPLVTEIIRLPELVLYDHTGFKGAFARTNLSFNYIGDYWNDRISCLIVVSGVWRFYRDDYYKGPYWDLGPGFYESFFTAKGPDDIIGIVRLAVADAAGIGTADRLHIFRRAHGEDVLGDAG